MPWIAEDMCIGCGVCVDECYPGAISLQGGIAVIDDDSCIRCGVCHDICVEEAIRHDGELVADEVEENLAWARKLLAHEYYLGSDGRRAAFVERLERYFAKERKVAEETIECLGDLLD